MPETPVNTGIEGHFLAAEQGDKVAVREFLSAVLRGPLYVPDRYQAQPLSDQPQYPNDLVHVMGIKDKERTVVPAFSRAELIEEWSGTAFSFKQMQGTALFNALPEGWWVSINPGSEIGKELSPWEIDALKAGEPGINEITEELCGAGLFTPIEVRPAKDNEYQTLKKTLTTYASEHSTLKRLFLLIEDGRDENDAPLQRLLVGAETEAHASADAAEVRESLTTLSQRCEIGGSPVRVFVGTTVEGSLMLGAFRGHDAFYERRTPSIGARLRAWWKLLCSRISFY